jgi:hypothetical protein
LQEEKKTLERELARSKIQSNRVAVVVANEWKDQNDKVMPVRQWLEERRFMQVGYLGAFVYTSCNRAIRFLRTATLESSSSSSSDIMY